MKDLSRVCGGLVVVATLWFWFGHSPPALAADLKVAYINADTSPNLSYLGLHGIDATAISNPIGLTLGALSAYDALLISSNQIFSDPTTIGNVAADFADAGGGVVLSEFVFQGMWALSGRIMTAGYSPFTVDPLSSGYVMNSALGTIYDTGSPILTGVTTTSATQQFQGDLSLQGSAHLVADWASGRRAIAYTTPVAGRAVVGLNLYPDQAWLTSPDSQLIVANALHFSVNSGTAIVPEPSSWMLMAVAATVLAWRTRRRVG